MLVTNDEPERVRGTSVTEDFFPLFRTTPFKGRLIQADDFKEGNDSVAIVNYALWQRRFGASDHAIGSKIQVSNFSITIVGVMPPGFDYPTQTEIWFPLRIDPAKEQRFNRFLNVRARRCDIDCRGFVGVSNTSAKGGKDRPAGGTEIRVNLHDSEDCCSVQGD